MTEQRQHILSELAEVFGDRCRPPEAGELAIVSPASVDEVEALSRIAVRHSVPVVAEGAGMMRSRTRPDGVLARFELMRAVSVPEPPHYRVEAQPGLTWQELEDHLQRYGRSLRVHPTSAPKSTVGGWVALDGLGVGSFEYGWLSENVASADLVMPDGERISASGVELPLIRPSGSIPAIIGSVRLETRTLERDLPFAGIFEDPVELSRVTLALHEVRVPLWHLGIQNTGMSLSRGHGERHVLFGAYPARRSEFVEGALRAVFRETNGSLLPPAKAHRVWGTRHFPTSLTGHTPGATHILLPIRGLETLLSGVDEQKVALQGSIGCSGEVSLLAFGRGRERGSLEILDPADKERLMRSVIEGGGREHRFWAI